MYIKQNKLMRKINKYRHICFTRHNIETSADIKPFKIELIKN